MSRVAAMLPWYVHGQVFSWRNQGDFHSHLAFGWGIVPHPFQGRCRRLVFIPFTRRGKCYFVDSKADEEKIRAFLNMYRIPNTLISFLMTPMVMVPGLILEDYGGLTPREHRLTIALGNLWVFLAELYRVGINALGCIPSSGSGLNCLVERGRT
jgi:hypothetical protein